MKTSELTGAALDWAVAKCEGLETWSDCCQILLVGDDEPYHPSTDWAQGGPIIEREGILLRPLRKDGHPMNGLWLAMYDDTNTGSLVRWMNNPWVTCKYSKGPTPLIAAMCCLVCAKLGVEVKVPEELI